MPVVWFIRHGESESNANLRTSHPAKTVLTPKGVTEADAIVKSFVEKPSLIVVSPYLRARQTAVPTINHFHPVPQEEWPVYEFTYLHPIRYKGTTVMERRPFALEYWQRNDPHYKDGGQGESFTELMARIQETTARLHACSANFIAVFSHGLFLSALVWSLLTDIFEATPETMEQYSHFVWAVRMLNGAIFKTTFADDGEVTFSGFDTSHLQT